MTAIRAYQTVDQLLYAGTASRLIDLNEVVSQVPIPSNVESRARVVLGSDYPTLTVTRVSYRIAIPAMLIGPESEQLRTTAANDVAAIQTDAGTAMVMKSAIVGGVPEQAQANGEIVGGVTLQPGGAIYRCEADDESGSSARSASVTNGSQVFAVITSGSGTLTRGGSNFAVAAGGGVADLGTVGNSVGIPAAITGIWVLEGTRVGV